MEKEFRIRVQADHPDAELIDWLKQNPDGRSMVLQAIRAFWLAEKHPNQALWCWNALLQQCSYLILKYNIPTPISATSPFPHQIQQAQPFITQPLDRRVSQPIQPMNPFE
jgi:hypothetical protein